MARDLRNQVQRRDRWSKSEASSTTPPPPQIRGLRRHPLSAGRLIEQTPRRTQGRMHVPPSRGQSGKARGRTHRRRSGARRDDDISNASGAAWRRPKKWAVLIEHNRASPAPRALQSRGRTDQSARIITRRGQPTRCKVHPIKQRRQVTRAS